MVPRRNPEGLFEFQGMVVRIECRNEQSVVKSHPDRVGGYARSVVKEPGRDREPTLRKPNPKPRNLGPMGIFPNGKMAQEVSHLSPQHSPFHLRGKEVKISPLRMVQPQARRLADRR